MQPQHANSDLAFWPAGLRATLCVINAAAEPFVVLWGDALRLYQNSAAGELLGDPEARQVGRELRACYPELSQTLVPQLEACFAGGQGAEFLLTAQLRATTTALFDGETIGGVLVRLTPHSMTGIEKLDEALDSSEFRRLANEIPHSIWTHDAQGHITWGNHHFYATTKFTRNVRLSREVWSKIFHPDHLENDLIPLDAARSFKAAHEGLYRVRTAHASQEEHRWHSIRTVPLAEVDGEIGEWLCISTDVHERHAAEDVRADDLRKFSEAVSQIIWQATPDGTVDYINTAFYDFTGLNPNAESSNDWAQILHPDDVAQTVSAWDAAIQSGESFELEHRFRRSDGMYRWFSTRGTALRESSGRVVRWLATSMHIDGRKRNEQIKLFLAEALSTLARSSNIIESCRGISQQATTFVAEFSLIDLRTPEGSLQRIAWSHRDPVRQQAMSTCTNCPPFCGFELESRFSSVVTSRRAALVRDWKLEMQQPHFSAEAQADAGVSRWLEISSLVTIPLLGRSELIGTLTLARAREGDLFEEADIAVLEDVGRCIGLALESAEHAERNRLVADRFQHAALPKNLPNIPGFTFSAVYQAAKSEAYVGGDWYDAFRLADGQIVLSIGDVIGNGLDAAVTMGAVRQAIRGAAQIYPDPVAVLNAADRALRSDQPNRIVTAFVAVLDPITLTLRYASAGHPPPMLCTKTGKISALTASDLPLGLRDHRIDEPPQTLAITEPALLVLYTDGLTEATHNILEGEDRLREALTGSEIFTCHDPAAAIHDAIVIRNELDVKNKLACYAQDDVAVLVVRIDDVSGFITRIDNDDIRRANWQLDVTDHLAAKRVRGEIVTALRQHGATENDLCDAELLFSELIGNVIRHGGGSAQIAIDLSSLYPVLHVLDRGPGFTFFTRLPNDVMSESGRGLYIAAMLTRELSVVRRSDGGSHARAVLSFSSTGHS